MSRSAALWTSTFTVKGAPGAVKGPPGASDPEGPAGTCDAEGPPGTSPSGNARNKVI